MTDYAYLTLAEVATQIRQKAISPVEYLQALLERIDTYDAHYNAFAASSRCRIPWIMWGL